MSALTTQRVNLHLEKRLVKQVERLAKKASRTEGRLVYPVEIYRRLLRAGLKAENGK